ncbi:MAG: FGGY-family carbohydrate kinase, partial [Kiloniellales bacterium]
LFLGIDVGTGGIRACAIDGDEAIRASAHAAITPPGRDGANVRQDPQVWWRALEAVLIELGGKVDLGRVAALAVDGTSGTILLADEVGEPLAAARMYNDQGAAAQGQRIDQVAPDDSMARGTGGSLARMLALLDEVGPGRVHYALHQADWIAGRLTGRFGLSDYNNCLKLGFDAAAEAWPGWMAELGFDQALLPQVAAPGSVLAPVSQESARRFGLALDCLVLRGTTDGNAAFLAAGDFAPGVAVSSLGSTLTVKLVSEAAVFAPAFGVYSHRLLGHWLAGGASNSGGAAIARFFSPRRIAALTPALDPEQPTGLDYYPLPAPGERFPVADPAKQPVFEPRPADDAVFLQAILEGIARIEKEAYDRLAALGATPVRRVSTVGGGAGNAAWTRIRARVLRLPVTTAPVTEAAFGAARLARLGFEHG